MRRSDADETTNEDGHLSIGIGLREPERMRIAALKHPAGDILPAGADIPCLLLRGLWLKRLGMLVGGRVFVETSPGRVVLTLDDTPVPIPYRYQRHTPKKKRRGREAVEGVMAEGDAGDMPVQSAGSADSVESMVSNGLKDSSDSKEPTG